MHVGRWFDPLADSRALRCPRGPSPPQNKTSKTKEDEAEIKRLYGKFGMWHGISSMSEWRRRGRGAVWQRPRVERTRWRRGEPVGWVPAAQ